MRESRAQFTIYDHGSSKRPTKIINKQELDTLFWLGMSAQDQATTNVAAGVKEV